VVLFLGNHEETELFLQHNLGRWEWRISPASEVLPKLIDRDVLSASSSVGTNNSTLSPSVEEDASAHAFSVSLKKHDDLREIIVQGWSDFDDWLVFLHPEQRRLVEMDFSAPMRVRGRSGTGKTLVLLHRAFRLAAQQLDKDNSPVLIFTRNQPIAIRLQGLVDRLCQGDVAVRRLLQVSTIDDWCEAFLRSVPPRPFKVDGDGSITTRVIGEQLPSLVGAGLSVSDEDLLFYSDEIAYLFGKFEDVSDVRLRYLDPSFKREGRRRSFRHNARVTMFNLYCVIETELTRLRHYHKAQLAREALSAVRSSTQVQVPKMRAVMLDEAQVASENELKLLNAIAKTARAELFMAGDDDQAILAQGLSLASTGIHLQHGVPCVLNGNYRNSRQIAEFMNRFAAVWASTVDGKKPSASRGLAGPKPIIVVAPSETDELKWVASSVIDLIERMGFRPGQICCVMRGNDWRVKLMEELHRLRPTLAVEANRKTGVNRDSVKVTTIESTLGQEFRAMFIVNATEGSLPSTGEQTELHRDARLFYTAAGRARDRLCVSYSERIGVRLSEGSRFIECVAPVCDMENLRLSTVRC